MNFGAYNIIIPVSPSQKFLTQADDVCKKRGLSFWTIQVTPGTSLMIPDARADSFLRHLLMDRADSLEDAYKAVYTYDWERYIPPPAMRPCILNVLREKFYDPQSGKWIAAGGYQTCIGYHKCAQEYYNSFIEHPVQDELDRRVKIDTNVWIPSPNEQICIKAKFATRGRDIGLAYTLCKCADIFPTWPTAKHDIETALINKPTGNLYLIIKSSYQLYKLSMEPITFPVLPESPGMSPTDETDEKKSDLGKYLPWVALAAYLISKR